MTTQENKSINESQNTINEAEETDILQPNQNEIKGKNYVLRENVRKFIEKIEQKKDEKVAFEDFFLFTKILTDNQISPLMTYILKNAIDKYNDSSIENGIEKAGFGNFPGITNTREGNNEEYFDSKEAFVLYATFPENYIAKFWSEHQLLSDLLGVNPIKEVLSSKLKLAKTISFETKSHNSKDEKKSNKSNKSNKEKSTSSQKEQKIIDESNNREYYKLSLGAKFEFNALQYLLYGIKKYKNFPRIIYYPIVEYLDYDEIDTVILIEEMKPDFGTYYKNFKSIDLNNQKAERKDCILRKNDLVFVETSFEIETKKNKIYDFLVKICGFIKLYENIGEIKNLDEYTIKPIILYNNNYYLREDNIKDIQNSIKLMETTILKLNNIKLKEIYENLQIIYCWPTIPLFNNFNTYNDLNTKIEEIKKENQKEIQKIKKENQKEIQKIKKENQKEIKKIQKENQKEIKKIQKEIQKLKKIINKLQKNSLKIADNNYNYYGYKSFNNKNYYKKYNNKYNYKYSNYRINNNYQRNYHYKYFNNINNNNYYYNNYH